MRVFLKLAMFSLMFFVVSSSPMQLSEEQSARLEALMEKQEANPDALTDDEKSEIAAFEKMFEEGESAGSQEPPVEEAPAVAAQEETSEGPSMTEEASAEVTEPEKEQEVAAPVKEEKVEQKQDKTPAAAAAKPSADQQQKKPKKEQAKKDKTSAVRMLDTVKMDKGSWLFKKVWFDKFLRKFEKASLVAKRTAKFGAVFHKKRNDVDKNLFDPFYMKAGLSRGELTEVISHLVSQIKTVREKEITLTEKERAFVDKLTEEEKILEELNADVKAIWKLDKSIDDALTILMEQINISLDYEAQALKLFKQITKVLDHNKAEKIYHQMDALWKNISNIEKYIKGKFTRYFDSLIESSKQQVERIQNTLGNLKTKGIDLKKEFDKLEAAAEEPEQEEKAISEEPVEEETEGWLASFWGTITWPITALWEWISSWWS